MAAILETLHDDSYGGANDSWGIESHTLTRGEFVQSVYEASKRIQEEAYVILGLNPNEQPPLAEPVISGTGSAGLGFELTNRFNMGKVMSVEGKQQESNKKALLIGIEDNGGAAAGKRSLFFSDVIESFLGWVSRSGGFETCKCPTRLDTKLFSTVFRPPPSAVPRDR